MWILESIKTGTKYHLLEGNEYSVGRKGNDILLLSDLSISRNHAKVVVSAGTSNVESSCKVFDLKSKYGTSYDDNKVSLDGCDVHSGGKITFGLCGNEFVVKKEKLLVTTSCLDKKQKKELDAITRLGGKVVSHFEPGCQYLVMTGIKVTTKAISAMILQRPIVTLQFFNEWWSCVQQKKPLPNPCDYMPPVDDPHVDATKVSFHPVKARSNLFKGKTFVFIDLKQHQKLRELLKLGGAEVVIYNDSDIDSLILPDVCVMDVLYDGSATQESSQVTNKVAEVRNYLRSHGRRMIPESDIGFAVVYASTKEYCNPEFSFGSSILTSKLHVSQSCTQKEVYVSSTVPECTPQVENTITQTVNTSKDVNSSDKPKDSHPSGSLETETNKTLTAISDTFGTSLSFSQVRNSLKRHREQHVEETLPATTSKSLRLESENADSENALENITEVCESPEHEISSNFGQENIKQEPVSSSSQQVEDTLPSSYALRLNKDGFHTRASLISKTPIKRGLADMETEDTMTSKRFRKYDVDSANFNTQGECKGERNKSTSKIKSVEKPGSITNGYLATGIPLPQIKEGHEEEPKKPCQMMQVVMANLVVRKPGEAIVNTAITEAGKVKNVKKFRKVQPIQSRILPRIIGRRDVVSRDGILEFWNPITSTWQSKEEQNLNNDESKKDFESEEEVEDRPTVGFSWD